MMLLLVLVTAYGIPRGVLIDARFALEEARRTARRERCALVHNGRVLWKGGP